MEGLFTTLAAAGIARGRPLPRLGLHRRERAQPHRAPAVHARRRVRAPRLGARRAFAVTAGRRTTCDAEHRRAGCTGHVPRCRTPDRSTAPRRHARRRAGSLDANGLPIHQATPQPASFICNIPRAALPSAAGPAVPARASHLRPRPPRLEHRGQRRQRRGHGQRAQLRLLRHQVDRHGGRGRRHRRRHPAGPLASSRPSPTACSRAILNQLFLARLMIHPHGFVSDPAFQDASGQPGDRHERRLLRRQQPGRHLRRHGHGDRDRTSPAACSACPGMNYSLLLHAQHRLRHLLGGPAIRPTPTSSSGRCFWRSSRCCGIAPIRTATRST